MGFGIFKSTLLDPSWDDGAVTETDMVRIREAQAIRDGADTSFDEDRAISVVDSGALLNQGLRQGSDASLRRLTRKEAEVLAQRMNHSAAETDALLARHEALQRQAEDPAVRQERLRQIEAKAMARIRRPELRKLLTSLIVALLFVGCGPDLPSSSTAITDFVETQPTSSPEGETTGVPSFACLCTKDPNACDADGNICIPSGHCARPCDASCPSPCWNGLCAVCAPGSMSP